ncbi:MAG: hypothetical protein HUU57_05495 [Bdellovibrio sp.]|nr:hypothetical protein [Bdellovibrio sp.]
MLHNRALLSIFACSSVVVIGCAYHPSKDASYTSSSPTAVAAAEVGTSHYTVINFKPGAKSLSREEKSKIRELAALAERQGKVAEFKVLAWSDKEYPADGAKVASADSKLADDRANEIENFLEKDVNTSADVDTHNMAKRPNMLGEMTKSDDYEIKTTFEATGAAPTTKQTLKSLLPGATASKAIILVR